MSAEIESTEARTQKLEGLGAKRKRVEDARFTQGKGNYVDDLKFPGMLFGDFVRSPYGHARVKSIDKEAALKLPGVKAVLTAADLKPLKLDFMPTLAGDVQAVLAGDKVLFQGQEVAFVVAEDRYIAADAVELVEVEYEGLAGAGRSEPRHGRRHARLARRSAGQDQRRARSAQARQPHLHLGSRRRRGHRQGPETGRRGGRRS